MSTRPATGTAADVDDADDANLIAEIDAELAAEARSRRRADWGTTGLVLLIGGAIAWIGALILTVEKMHLLADPGLKLGCDVNPFISCGSVMMTWQASTFFGIPNMAIGLAGFAIMGAAGSLILSRAALPAWFRWAVLGGMAFAFAFIHWLAISAIFVIGALCPWCMLVWAMTAPMFFATTAWMVENGDLRLPAGLAALQRRWVLLTILWYAIVVGVIVWAFFGQWMAMLGL
ncbi:vitamin K epoxide reductase family protein [Brachybacterium huguangmaarense]